MFYETIFLLMMLIIIGTTAQHVFETTPTFTVLGSVSSTSAKMGDTVVLSATITSDMGPLDIVVDLELYDSNGKKIFQWYKENQQVDAQKSQTWTANWIVPTTNIAVGTTFTFSIGVFKPNWSGQYVWKSNAATVTIITTVPTSNNVLRTESKVNGILCDVYSWQDTKNLQRTIALKKEGNGNSGHGGYAIQMTYIIPETKKMVTINANDNDSHGGWGYFVSHERFRRFGAGDNNKDSIAHKFRNEFPYDDSPLGRNFPAQGQALTGISTDSLAHRFTTTYYRWGTIKPVTNEEQILTTNRNDYTVYPKPVTITWVFETLTDYPRIDIVVDTSQINGSDLVNFDLRGPYGVMDSFDDGLRGVVTKVMWGDRYHFQTLDQPVTGPSRWSWNEKNNGARYNALVAGDYEMGLFEPKLFSQSALADGWSNQRGTISTNAVCSTQRRIPCGNWPYQSIENNFGNPTNPTNYKLLAWGSSAFYGSSLSTVYEGPTGTQPLNGWPANRNISYSLCLVLGKTIDGGLTKSVAANPSSSACAKANF